MLSSSQLHSLGYQRGPFRRCKSYVVISIIDFSLTKHLIEKREGNTVEREKGCDTCKGSYKEGFVSPRPKVKVIILY
jgi:hypothetical protein